MSEPHSSDISSREYRLSELSSCSNSPGMGPLPPPPTQIINSISQFTAPPDHHPTSLALQYDFNQHSNLSSSEISSVFRHHRHPSNASEASSSSPFPEQLYPDPSVQSSASKVHSYEEPTTSFVDEPLPMEGDFATMDIHSPSTVINSFLPPTSSLSYNPSQSFRYDTLTWEKDHPYPEPQDTILATGGFHPKSSFSQLVAMFESDQQPPDPSKHSFQHSHLPHSPSSKFQSIDSSDHLNRSNPQDSLDQSHQSAPHSTSSSSRTVSIDPICDISNNQQIPTITTSCLSPNSNSPPLRLNMNYPAMPQGPSISFTSATPCTAKPGQQIEQFFETIDSLHSKSNDLFQPLMTQPLESIMQSSHQPCTPQANPFLNSRPVRARQRSKSESMGMQNSTLAGSDAMLKFSFGNQASCAPLITEFPPSDHWIPSSSPATTSYFNTSQLSSFWATPLDSRQQPNPTCQMSQFGQQLSSNEGRSQLLQQFISSSYLPPSLFEGSDQKKELSCPSYDPSFLKPTASVNHRRSHSVSHVHRRGRSEGEVPTGKLQDESTLDSFLHITDLAPSIPTNHWLACSQEQSNNTVSMTSQQNSVLNDPNRSTPIPDDVLIDGNHKNTIQQYNTPHVHSPVPSDACLSSQYSSRPRSLSHCSSFGSEETGASGPPSTSLVPLELRSKTTPATKAAAVKRRKSGVAARYVCDMCGETFTRRYNLRGHQRAHKGEKPFACGFPGCSSRFARAHDQKRHYKLHLGVKDYSCPTCKKKFIRLDALQRHHKSDAGQACFQQLQQTRTRSSTGEKFIVGDPNDMMSSKHFLDGSQSFVAHSCSNQVGEPQLYLYSQPKPDLVTATATGSSQALTGNTTSPSNNELDREAFFQI